jgi:hypothetical protein
MKLSSRLEQLKRQRQTRQTAPGSAGPQGGKGPRRRWTRITLCLILPLGLLLAVVGTWAVLEFVLWNQVPAALVGTWQVTEGPMAGGTFTFSRRGTVAIHAHGEGTNFAVNARVVVAGKVLLTVSQDPQTGQEQTRKSTIQELTASSLVLRLENGEVLRMARKE